MGKLILLEPEKSVPGQSIIHYSDFGHKSQKLCTSSTPLSSYVIELCIILTRNIIQ